MKADAVGLKSVAVIVRANALIRICFDGEQLLLLLRDGGLCFEANVLSLKADALF